jgi:hypothetical protein
LGNYNKTLQTTVSPSEDVEKKATPDFRQAQVNAGKFLHNNSVTQWRLTAVRQHGLFRAPTNTALNFKPQYVQRLQSADSQFETGVNGKKHLLKLVHPISEGSENMKGQLPSDRHLKLRLRSIADTVADFTSQQGGIMSLQNLEAVVRRGVGLPGIFKTIRKNRTTLRNRLKLFADLFKVQRGVVSLVVANIPTPVEVVETREERMDREPQARREEADRARDEKQRARLSGLRAAYPEKLT